MINPKKSESKFEYSDIKELLALGESFWSSIHAECKSDVQFSYATDKTQWDPSSIAARGGRPIETYNIINGFIRPVVNLAEQNPPAINIFPISDGASKTNAKLLSGVIRAIEYGCGAQREYTSGLNMAVRGGLGILRVIPKLSDIDHEDVEFIISAVTDPSNVLIDPSAKKQDYSDAQWVIIKSTMSERQYKRDYPDGRSNGVDGLVNIYELWIKEFKKVKKLDPIKGQITKNELKIIQYVFDDIEILETIDDYPGKYLPFSLITGAKYLINEEVHLQSLTREIRGIQKEINFLKSEQIATIACAPKSTFYGDNDVFSSNDEQDAWETSPTNPRVFLGHKPGANIQQFKMPEIPAAYIESCSKNIDLARVITGIYPDPTTQNGLSPLSGKALKQQQAGQAIATYEYINALNYAIKHVGEILLDLLPHYWNDNRIRLSMGVDGKYTAVSMGDMEIENTSNFDLAYGRYSVSISTGPSYSSQKDALIEMIMDAIKQYPQAMAIALPWIINQISLPGSEELADMFALTLPPEIQQFMAQMKGNSADPEEQLKSAMMTLQKLGQDNQQKSQLIDQLTAALENETQQLQSKEAEMNMKAQIETEKNQTQIAIAHMREEYKAQAAQLEARVNAMIAEQRLQADQQKQMLDIAAKSQLMKMGHDQDLENKAVDHIANKDSKSTELEHAVIKTVLDKSLDASIKNNKKQ